MSGEIITGENIDQFINRLEENAGTPDAQDMDVRIEPAVLHKLAERLNKSPNLSYNYLSDITAVDYLGESPRFEVIYRLYSIPANRRLWIRTRIDADTEIPSTANIWRNADWLEREVYDMFGIRFAGHPDLRRILTPTPWIGHPLRKDHPLGGEEVQFTFNTGDIIPQEEFISEHLEGMDFAGYIENGDKIESEAGAGRLAELVKEGKLIVSMGPQHPSTHGVLRVILALEGENIYDVGMDIGYVHTGIEKTAESLIYQQALTLTDRIDYVAPIANNLAWSLAVEKLLGLDIPERAQFIRVMLAELTRIASHLVWLGTSALDIGAVTPFLYTFREREMLLDIFELVSGQRMMTSYINIGGLRDDIPDGFIEAVKEFIKIFPDKLDDYHKLLTKNPIWVERTRGVGCLSLNDAINCGVSGPVLRASGLAWDVRKVWPYSSYDEFEFDIPVGEHGDVYDRYLVRMEEMRQSLRIVEQAVNRLPSGAWRVEDYKLVLPPRDRLDKSMEALIYHFLVSTEGFPVPRGDAYTATEGTRGETGFYVVSDGRTKPYRARMRSASFSTLQSLPLMARGHMVADMAAILGSIDMIMGEVDR